MLKCKNTGILVKQNSNIIRLYDMLSARTSCERRKPLCAGHTHDHKHDFLRDVCRISFFQDFLIIFSIASEKTR